jgi:O-acetyl-ADP-ribose deacetylase (regulator of RNase III)
MLMRGGGVAGAIHKAAGKELKRYCEPYAPINTGETLVSPAFNLSNKYVIHAVGPKYFHDKNPAELLKTTITNVLAQCEKFNIQTIALPAISTGSYSYPTKEAAEIIIKTLQDWSEKLPALARLVIFDEETYQTFKKLV